VSATRTALDTAASVRAPVGLLAELTHRCPLQCPYCSKPLALERAAGELPTEVWLDVLAQAADNLHAFSERGVTLQRADGRCGVPEAAPFDRIMVTAATPDLEPAWLDQLAERGLLLAPLALAPGLAFVVRGSVANGVFHGRLTRAALSGWS